MNPPDSVFYIFIDGIGFGSSNQEVNPFSRFAKSLFLPLAGKEFKGPGILTEADAKMGVEGKPQSATGQTALFTGINGAAMMGRHINGFPTYSLRPVLLEHSITKVFQDHGYSATLLNSYSDWYIRRISKPRSERLLSASSYLQKATGLPFFRIEDYLEGRSLYMDITNWFLRRKFHLPIPMANPKEVGRKAVRIASKYNLAIFEYFFTDKAGHAMSFAAARRIIPHIEGFLEGVYEELDPEKMLLVVSSDHGNLEDLSDKTHTENKVPVYLYGKGADLVSRKIQYLYDIPRALYDLFNISKDFTSLSIKKA
ncbi:MAG: metalloenzyme [Candidatus Hydrogenedentota bacterium]|nr:MAG: metalloenzyme [Candidatus Hydrogenedentota bacterium]